MTLFLALLLQSLVVDLCPKTGKETVEVPKLSIQSICFSSIDSPNIKYFRLRRSPVQVGIFVHFQQILLPQAQKVQVSYTDLDGTQKTKNMLRVVYQFPVTKTYYYCASTVYDDAGTQRETNCSNQLRIGVQP